LQAEGRPIPGAPEDETPMTADRRARSFLDRRVIARLGGFPLFARRPMLGTVSGRHPSPHRGASVEFAEYRKYVQGDDLRRLDWRAFGRSDRYYIKEFEADTNLRCCLVIDSSGSMDFGSAGVSKVEYARRIAGTIGYIAVQQGDAVGLTCVADGVVREVPPRRNPAHLSAIFDVMEQIRPSGPTRLVETLHQLAETIRQRALIVIVSDLFVPAEGLRECFDHLRFRRHDAAVFHLLDPQELAFDFRRPTRFLDMEGGPAVFAEPAEIADRYREALDAYLDGVRSAVREAGVDYHRASIDEDYERVLTKFFVGRTRPGRAR
jgi:uncharacterized protein (DUF58 family)